MSQERKPASTELTDAYTNEPGAQADTARAVGQVVGTEDATPLTFHVAIYPESYLQLDDVVATAREVPGRGQVTTYGVVTQVRSRHEGASFGSDVFDFTAPPRAFPPPFGAPGDRQRILSEPPSDQPPDNE